MAATADRHRWTPEAVRALGITTDLTTAASILDIGRTKAYELVRKNQFPVLPIKAGTRYAVPTAPRLAALGADEPPETAEERAPGPATQKSTAEVIFRELARENADTLHAVHARIEDAWRQQGRLPPEADGLWTAIGRFIAVYGDK
ncbi:hypothetical protein [Frankia sp. AgKG'84/4]|uniref:hypothetical protein n=1 Tax=Frankia sp. AgKG'84/4 TaxID=573490 RepID=UPI00200DCC38|nr:hypothetical protein [Frankia sp. AgKG'84/4]MCL9793092.1 hypothetical protein [Frankia sp. AgKG'84/4]